MALTPNAIPTSGHSLAHPFDAATAFCSAAALSATGYLGSPTQLDLGLGRQSGLFIADLTTIKVSTGDEYYRFFLLGSNDSAFGNGNVENLGMKDIAAASAARIVPTIMGASPALPAPGRAGAFLTMPFQNTGVGNIIYRYVRAYAVLGGTSPSIASVTAWLSTDSSGGGNG